MRALLLLGGLLLAGCRREPAWYPLPPQREYPQPPGLRPFVDVSEPGAEAQWVEGLTPGTLEGNWIWAARRVALRVQAPERRGVQVRIEYGIGDEPLKQDGTQTLRFYLDGRLLGEKKHTKADGYQFEQAVAEEWIIPERPQLLVIESDRYWVDSGTKREMSFLLARAGLIR